MPVRAVHEGARGGAATRLAHRTRWLMLDSCFPRARQAACTTTGGMSMPHDAEHAGCPSTNSATLKDPPVCQEVLTRQKSRRQS